MLKKKKEKKSTPKHHGTDHKQQEATVLILKWEKVDKIEKNKKLVLIFSMHGLKEVLKSLKFNLKNLVGTL